MIDDAALHTLLGGPLSAGKTVGASVSAPVVLARAGPAEEPQGDRVDRQPRRNTRRAAAARSARASSSTADRHRRRPRIRRRSSPTHSSPRLEPARNSPGRRIVPRPRMLARLRRPRSQRSRPRSRQLRRRPQFRDRLSDLPGLRDRGPRCAGGGPRPHRGRRRGDGEPDEVSLRTLVRQAGRRRASCWPARARAPLASSSWRSLSCGRSPCSGASSTAWARARERRPATRCWPPASATRTVASPSACIARWTPWAPSWDRFWRCSCCTGASRCAGCSPWRSSPAC